MIFLVEQDCAAAYFTINYRCTIFYRITDLEKIQLSSTSLRQVQKYKETIKELIENDNISKEEQQILLEFHKKHFGE